LLWRSTRCAGPKEAPEPQATREPSRLDERLEDAEALQERVERELPPESGADAGPAGG